LDSSSNIKLTISYVNYQVKLNKRKIYLLP